MDLRKSIFFYADLASFPVNGAADILYVDKDTGFIYSWNGSTYLAAGTGGLNYLGLWDANANSPAITSGIGSVGDYYIVGTAGTTNIDGISDWEVGDWIIFGGSAWQKIDNSEVNLNIYNSDGTLTGNRTASLDGHKLIFDNGSVGINVNPSTTLHVNALAVPAGEAVARFGVTDSSGYVQIANGTGTNNVFAPLLQGKQVGTSLHAAIGTEGIIDPVDDIGTTPITLFKARLSDFTSPLTRPLFQFTSWSFNVMTMLANGNVGIGTATPGEKLEVNGKTKTSTFQMTATPTAGYVLTSDASGNGSWSAAAGGLTYFTEAQNTAAPNATIPVDSLTAVSAATSADFAIIPKGQGALLGQVPDNTFTNGNKRGLYAVDWQRVRNVATRVASGTYSTIIGGIDCTASNSYSIAGGNTCSASGSGAVALGQLCTSAGFGSVSLGYSNTSSADYSSSIGYLNTASGTQSIALGGQATASGTLSVATSSRSKATGYGSFAHGGYPYVDTTASADNSIAIGAANTASAQFGTAVGGYGNVASGVASYASGSQANTFGIYGRQSRGYLNTVSGDCQKSEWFLTKRTTDATVTKLTVGASAVGSQSQVSLQNNNAFRFKGTIIGKQSGSVNVAAWDIDGLIVRGTTAATTSIVIANVNLISNAPGWGTPTLTADTTYGCLTVQVAGLAATNIQWTAEINTTEVIYA